MAFAAPSRFTLPLAGIHNHVERSRVLLPSALMPLYPKAVHALARSADLEIASATGEKFTRVDGKAWTTAKAFLKDAQKKGERLPILFSDAAYDTSRVLYAGEVESLAIRGRKTTYVVTNLQRVNGSTQDLRLVSAGQTIAPDYRRSYALVHTPGYVGRAILSDTDDFLSEVLPDDGASQALADSILVAHAAGPMSWSLSLQENYLRLNVGPIQVLYFSPQETGVMVDEPAGRSIRATGINWSTAPRYAGVAGARWLNPPVEGFSEFYDRLRPAHVALIKNAARSRTRWPDSHSQALVAELARLTGRSLPAPGYVDADVSTLPDEDDAVFAAHEGVEVLRQHLARERNAALVEAKKKAVLKRTKKLACEVCGFDFEQVYGELGHGFAECHHAVALSTYRSGGRKTAVSELALVCANCHRMLHRRRPWLEMNQLRRLLT